MCVSETTAKLQREVVAQIKERLVLLSDKRLHNSCSKIRNQRHTTSYRKQGFRHALGNVKKKCYNKVERRREMQLFLSSSPSAQSPLHFFFALSRVASGENNPALVFSLQPALLPAKPRSCNTWFEDTCTVVVKSVYFQRF